MSKLTLFLKKYWIVITCAILAGTILSLGQYMSIRDLGNDYRGIPYLYQDNEDVYLSRIHELLEDNYSVASPYFFEYKNNDSPLLPYGEWFYALPIKALGLDVVTFVHFTKFLFPAILFVLVFCFAYILLDKKSIITAIVCAALVVLTPNFLSASFLKNIFVAHDSFAISIWTRLVNPTTGAILLFSFLILLFQARRQNLLWVVAAGILLGLMPGYYFSFALAGLFTFFLILIFLLDREFKIALRLLTILPVAFLVSAGYFIDQLNGILSGETLVTSLRNGMFLTHLPLPNNTLVLGFVAFIVIGGALYLKKREIFLEHKYSLQFILAMLLSGIFVFNQQLVTGKAIWPYHFVQYTKPFVLLTLVYCGYLLFLRYGKAWRAVMIFAVIFCFSLGVKDALSYRFNLEDFREYQRNAAVAGWLNSKNLDSCVVIVKEGGKLYRKGGNNIVEKLSLLLPAVTPCDVHFASYTFFNVPPERIFHGYLAYLRLNGVTEKTIEQFLYENRVQVITVFYENWAEMFYPGRNEPWLLSVTDFPKIELKIDALIERISEEYPVFMKQDFGQFLKQYKVDYLVYDKKYGGEWNRGWDKFLSKETELDEFVIYRFK